MKEKNFDAISVSEITARAGVSRISYYRNFDSKEDILIGSLNDLMSRFSDEINAVPSHTPTRRVMTVFFHTAREDVYKRQEYPAVQGPEVHPAPGNDEGSEPLP